jgi:hypothetical protein
LDSSDKRNAETMNKPKQPLTINNGMTFGFVLELHWIYFTILDLYLKIQDEREGYDAVNGRMRQYSSVSFK